MKTGRQLLFFLLIQLEMHTGEESTGDIQNAAAPLFLPLLMVDIF
jgi:hypothetical protein